MITRGNGNRVGSIKMVSENRHWFSVNCLGGPRGMEQNTRRKKKEIDKEFIDNLLKSYSERLVKAHEEIERLKHENAILKERVTILVGKKPS